MKHKLRKEYLEKRNKLTKEEIAEKSRAIEKALFGLEEYRKANVVMFYVSIGSEVFTHSMIKDALKTKKVVVPLTNKAGHSIEACHILSMDELEKGAYDIPEPKKECIRVVNPKEIDVVILPGVVFDKEGYRIGYGKGYYDKFLKKTNAFKIALAYDFKIVEKAYCDENDVPVDMIVTEKRVVRCR